LISFVKRLKKKIAFSAPIQYNLNKSGERWREVEQSGLPLLPGQAVMLIGEYQHNIDPKGRVIVPAKFREDLGERFYITKGLDGCLFVLSGVEWERLQEKIRQMPISKARGLQRFFFSGAAEVEPDKQGRVLIPQQLRDYAQIQKDVAVIGASSRAEIWDAARWAEFNSGLTEESIAEAMDILEL